MTDKIAGKTIVITGASSGMGAAAARHLAEKGAAVVLGARFKGERGITPALLKLFGGSAVYSATKFAVRALSEGLRQEMASHGIRTTIISPGAVKTELLDQISKKGRPAGEPGLCGPDRGSCRNLRPAGRIPDQRA